MPRKFDKTLGKDVKGILAHIRDPKRKHQIHLHVDGPGGLIFLAFWTTRYPYLDDFIKKGEAFAAIGPQSRPEYDGHLVVWYRLEGQSEERFLDVMRRHDTLAILDARWLEVVERLFDVPSLTYELQEKDAAFDRATIDLADLRKQIAAKDAALAKADAEWDHAMDLVCAVFMNNLTPEQRQRVERACYFAEARAVIDKLETLYDRMAAIEATLPHPLPSLPPPHESDLDDRPHSA
jgi:hypothetical protein